MKACFSFMAAFSEDYQIHASEVIRLWVARGFLECPDGSKSLEEEAEDCLEDLAERNLVQVTSRKFDGKIKSCSLHNIVRDFCVRQAGKEKLFLPVIDYLPTPILRRHFLPRIIKDHHNISATPYDLHLKDFTHSSHVRTIICTPRKGYRSVGSIEKFSSLRLLHVLRGRDSSWDWKPGQVFNLIHLTYLASNIPSSIVPSIISKLQNLETFIIYRSEVRLPVEIWRLRKLRHLIAFSFDALPLPHPEVEALPLENLHTLSLASDFVFSERIVKVIPNIKKLGICYSKKRLDEGYHIGNLRRMCQLEKLKLEMPAYFSRVRDELKLEIRRYFTFSPSLNPIFPLSLQKLTLSGWRLPWSDMAIIGSLPNLRVLKLRKYACSDQCWETNEGEFGELRLLLLDQSELCQWITKSSHFPRLECLIFRQCHSLYEIPSNIGDIPTLELIEVQNRFGTLFRSAERIQEK